LGSHAGDAALVKKARPGPPEKIDITFNVAVANARLPVDLQRVLEAEQIDIVNVCVRIGRRAVENNRFGLRTTVRRGVVQREIGDRQIPASMTEEQSAAIN